MSDRRGYIPSYLRKKEDPPDPNDGFEEAGQEMKKPVWAVEEAVEEALEETVEETLNNTETLVSQNTKKKETRSKKEEPRSTKREKTVSKPAWLEFSRVAANLMEQMGYQPGQGLGAHGQGILYPIEHREKKRFASSSPTNLRIREDTAKSKNEEDVLKEVQAASSQAELPYKNSKFAKDKLMEKYGNASTEDEIPRELLLGQSQSQGQALILPKSMQTIRNSYCTGSAGIEAAEAALDLKKVQAASSQAELPYKNVDKLMEKYGNAASTEDEIPMELLIGQSQRLPKSKHKDVHANNLMKVQADLLYENFKSAKDKLKSHTKDPIIEKYGNASRQDEIPMELLLGQNQRQRQEVIILPKSNANIARKEASEESPKKVEEKRMATSGTHITEDLESEDLELDKEDERKREEKDESKRTYTVKEANNKRRRRNRRRKRRSQ